VDPLSHVVVGSALVTACRRAKSPPTLQRGVGLAAALGALAPDVDAVFMPAGWDVYLRVHEIGTHSLAGTVPVAVLVAAVTGITGRWDPTRASFRQRAAAAWVGCLSHLALDLLSGAQVRIGWPLVLRHVSVPLIAMAEPAVVVMCAVTALLSVWVARRHRQLLTRSLLVLLALFFVSKAVLLGYALRTIGRDRDVEVRVVEARWGRLTEWYVLDRTSDALQRWLISPNRPATLLFTWPVPATPIEPALVRASRELSTVRNFLAVHELGFAGQVDGSHLATGPSAGTDEAGIPVLWSDLRFCGPAQRQDEIVLSTRAGTVSCGLWFGGSFDRAGRPLRELVRVGDWWQIRAPVVP
jgi:membrane-bound metal-dependent hydrolase YbcI (DUF457 family)